MDQQRHRVRGTRGSQRRPAGNGRPKAYKNPKNPRGLNRRAGRTPPAESDAARRRLLSLVETPEGKIAVWMKPDGKPDTGLLGCFQGPSRSNTFSKKTYHENNQNLQLWFRNIYSRQIPGPPPNIRPIYKTEKGLGWMYDPARTERERAAREKEPVPKPDSYYERGTEEKVESMTLVVSQAGRAFQPLNGSYTRTGTYGGKYSFTKQFTRKDGVKMAIQIRYLPDTGPNPLSKLFHKEWPRKDASVAFETKRPKNCWYIGTPGGGKNFAYCYMSTADNGLYPPTKGWFRCLPENGWPMVPAGQGANLARLQIGAGVIMTN